MSKFQGFPARTEFTPVPNAFFGTLLPEIDDIDELKTTLQVIAALYRKKGYPRYISFNELPGNAALMSGLKGNEERLRRALEKAAERGSLLGLKVERDGASENIYLLNDEPGRQAAAKIESGELNVGGIKSAAKPETPAESVPDIYTLYEQNIGILTPLVADELKEIEKLYPPEWLRDAIRTATLNNKRNINYINKILENWSARGRNDGTYQRHIKKAGSGKFTQGKYGHMVQR
jgi:DnaD/phage-associated family protein